VFERLTIPAPVLLIVPAPEITPEKLAVPPEAAVKVAELLLVILPAKVAVPAVSIPRAPEPEAAVKEFSAPVKYNPSPADVALAEE